MENSKTHGAKDKPACGRALTGKCEIDIIMAGVRSKLGSLSCNPVNGLTSLGKSCGLGPYMPGTAKPCGVGVKDGCGVPSVGVASAVELGDAIPPCALQAERSQHDMRVERMEIEKDLGCFIRSPACICPRALLSPTYEMPPALV